MNARTYWASFVSVVSMLAPTCLSQDVSEPISIREFLESSHRNGLAEHVERIGGLDAFDLMLVLQGEFAARSEAIGLTLDYNAAVPHETAKFTFVPHDYTRKLSGKNIRFVGKIRGKKISDLIQLAKKITENQNFGIHTENQDNRTAGIVEVYYLLQSRLINPRSDSVTGGWVANPQANTTSWKFLKLAYEVREMIRSAAEEAYPKWEGNLDMNRDNYNIKDEIIAATSASDANSTEQPTAEQPGAGQPATQPADKVPAEVQPPTPTSKDAPR